MFNAELKNQLLTAGHDLAKLDLPVTVDIATGSESYVTFGGKEQLLAFGTCNIRDGRGVISSIIYGPTGALHLPRSRRVLFTVYVPPGIASAAIHEHWPTSANKRAVLAPNAQVELLQVYRRQGKG